MEDPIRKTAIEKAQTHGTTDREVEKRFRALKKQMLEESNELPNAGDEP